jgi:hypothetical protein
VLNRTLDTSWCGPSTMWCAAEYIGTVRKSPQRNECIFQHMCIVAVLPIIGEGMHALTTKVGFYHSWDRGQRFINLEPQKGTIRRVNPPEA